MNNIKIQFIVFFMFNSFIVFSQRYELVKDITSGASGSNPTEFASFGNGKIVFGANDGVNGNELWISDGTSSGTFLLKDIRPGSTGSNPVNLHYNAAANLVFFTADDGIVGNELWKTDGTANGTVLVKDIQIGSNFSYPYNFISHSGLTFFNARDNGSYFSFWRTDGTESGTTKIFDGVICSHPSSIELNSVLYFRGDGSSSPSGVPNGALMRTDGTTGGTYVVSSDVNIFNNTVGFASIGDNIVFAGSDANGVELWKTDGTTVGTSLLKDIDISASSYPSHFTNFNNKIFFTAAYGDFGEELWSTDGTTIGTSLYKDFVPGTTGSYLTGTCCNNTNGKFITFDGSLFFFARSTGVGSILNLYKTDGIVNNYTLVSSQVLGPASKWVLGDSFFAFVAMYDLNSNELFISDGTSTGTKVFDILPGTGTSNITELVRSNNTIYFNATDGVLGKELWKIDLLEPFNQPSNISFSSVSSTSYNLSFLAPNTPTDGYLIVRRIDGYPTSSPIDGIQYTVGNLLGDGEVVYIGNSSSIALTGLQPATNCYYNIYSFRGSGANINYLPVNPLQGNETTLQSEPTAQPTSLAYSNVTINSMNVAFTAATNTPDGYIVLRRAGSAPTDLPVDGSVYSAGVSTIGDSDVVFVGTGTSFSQASLTANTTYHYSVFSYNGSGAAINYLTTSPLLGNRSTLVEEPPTGAVSLGFTSFTSSSISGFFVPDDPPGPNAEGHIVIIRANGSPTGAPVDGTTYMVGNAIGDGTVVAIGSGTTFSSLGLTPNTVYHYDVIAYNGSGNVINYNTTNRLEGSRTTLQTEPTAQPTALAFSNVTISTLDVSYTAAAGVDGYLVIRRAGAAPTGTPVAGTTYTTGNTLGDGTVVFVGSGTSFSQTGLTPNTNYFYSAYSYRGAGAATNYLTTSPLSGTRSTLATEPTSAPTSLVFPTFTTTSLGGSFTTTTADGYLVLQRATASPTGTPVDGTTYIVGNTIGDGTVVAVGATTTFTSSSLTANTVYHYDVIAYNGSGNIINYNTTNRLEGSRTTLQTEPAAQSTSLAFNNITISSLGASFTAASGSPDGYLVLRRQGAAPTGQPTDGTTYSQGAALGDGTIVHIGSTTNFTDAGLTAGTLVHYAVFSYNGIGQAVNYRTTIPLTQPVITISAAPTSSAASLVLQTSFQANWSSVTGASNYLLDVSQDNFSNLLSGYSGKIVTGLNDVVTGLTPGTTYQYRVRASNASGLSTNSATISQLTLPATPTGTAATSLSPTSFVANWTSVASATGYFLDVATDAAFTNFQVGYNNLPVSSTSQNVTGLSSGVTFYYRVRSVNATGISPSSSTIETATITTEPLAQPTAMSFSNLSSSGLTVSYTGALGSPLGYIALIKEGSAPTDLPQDGTAYTMGSALGGSKIAYIGSATTFSVSALNANAIHHVAIFSYNGGGLSINYLTSNPLTGSRSTLQTEPTAQATDIIFSNVSNSSLTGRFTAATGSPSGYLVLRKSGSVSTGVPSDGVSYTLNQSVGDGIVVSNGSLVTFDDTGLNAGSTYYYSVFSYNGSSDAINYLTTSSVSNSVITIAAAPTTQAGTSISQTSFTASWTSSTGAAAYDLDVSSDNFTTFITGYSAKSLNGTSEIISSLTPGTTYQYRVRAVNASGQSVNSNTTSQITIPQTPTASTASEIRTNDFKAKWTSVQGETGYELDVSTNNFVSFLTGYQSKTILAGVTEETVTGLSPSTQYQYRVRAKNAGGISPNSNVISVTTLAGSGTSPLAISNLQFPANVSTGQASIVVGFSVAGGLTSKSVEIYYRGILANAFTTLTASNPSGNLFQGTIPFSALDDLGLEFYIKASDGIETVETQSNFIYKSFLATESAPISSITKFGGTLETYQIISIPFQLEDNLISSVFEPVLGAYDQTKWRLVRFQNGKNTDYQAGLTRINQGESYWFNSIETVSIKPGAGTAPQFNQTKPFVLKLAEGWNQIATPYPFAIDWDDVLAANSNPADVGKYRVYVPASASFTDSNSLQPYSGGFVFADNAIDLEIPVSLKNTAGGRSRQEELPANLSAPAWFVPIEVKQGIAINTLSGVGMHPDARPGKDPFDEITLPRFVKHLELNSYHPEFFSPRFSKDVVPTQEQYVWNLVVESNFEDSSIELDWSAADLGQSDAQLLLYDAQQGVLLDMKQVRSYSLQATAEHPLQVLYYSSRKVALDKMLQIGSPYPNPSTDVFHFPVFSVNEAQVSIQVYDLMGRVIGELNQPITGGTVHQLTWGEVGKSKESIPPGLYVYKMKMRQGVQQFVKEGRLLVR